MKRNLLYVIISMMMSVQFIQAEQIEVKLVANNWCPQHCIDDKDSPGYLVELAQEALKVKKVNHTITFQPWLRASKNVHNGIFDGLLTPAQSEQKELLRHQVPLASQRFCFYSKKSQNLKLDVVNDFKNRSIAFVNGNHLGDKFMNYIENKKHNVKVYKLLSNDEEFAPRVFSFLLKQRVDAIAITEDMGDYYLGNNQSTQKQVKKNFCTKEELLHIGLSPQNIKRSQRISKLLDDGLLEIKVNGTYDKILRKYFLTSQ